MGNDPLQELLLHWRHLVQEWSRSGALGRAAQEALMLARVPDRLRELVARWGSGDFQDLPPVVVVPASALPRAAGAYGRGTGTIYLHGDWLRGASRPQVLAVLTEELGHHLDALLNTRDTPGDEGELFAALVQGKALTPAQREGLRAEDDRGWLQLGEQRLAVETSSATIQVALASGATVTEDGPQPLSVVFSRTGDVSGSLTVAFSVDGTASFGADYGQRGATSFGATSGSITFAPGASVAILTLDPHSDASSEGNESLALRLAPGSGYAVGGANTVGGTILDNDAAPGTVVRGRLDGRINPYMDHLNWAAFAALKSDGSVITWGGSQSGGDSSGVRERLSSGVVQIYASQGAFAALKSDGSVVVWGAPHQGGDSSGVSDKLSSGVTQIVPNAFAFAALKRDGSVVSWARSIDYGLRSGVNDKLTSDVVQITSTRQAFAALKSDGSVTTWGQPRTTEAFKLVGSALSSGVAQIFANDVAFAALKRDGSVYIWGEPRTINDGNAYAGFAPEPIFTDCISIISGSSAFAALKPDGSVDIWESDPYGNSISRSWVSSGVLKIFANGSAFAALKQDGSVVTWGYPQQGGDSSGVSSQLSSGVSQIIPGAGTFAALKTNGSVVTWGDPQQGGDSSRVADQLTSGVSEIIANGYAFAALKTGGAVVTWGHSVWGGDSSDVRSELASGVARLFANANSFVALKTDGSVVSWGGGSQFGLGSRFGGDSSEVASQLRNGVVSFVDPFSDDRLVPLTLPVITLALAPASVTEDGLGNLLFTFTRTGPTTAALTVNFAVGGTATLGTDYTGIAAAGTTKQVTFAAGSATATVVVDPTADTTVEDNETVALTLATGTGYTIGTPSAVTGTIVNDDPPVITLALSPASVAEDGAANLLYTFSRTGPTTSALTVNFTVGGTATLGTDYTGIAAAGTTKQVTFAAGSATATVVVDPTADTTVEDNETVALTLATGAGYTIGTPSAVTGTIVNDDPPVITLALSSAFVAEDGAANLLYTFSRTGPTTSALTVNFTVGGTATLGTDYTGIAAAGTTKQVTFAAGSATATVVVDPTADTAIEANETVALTLATGAGYTIGTPTPVVGTIANDDITLYNSATGRPNEQGWLAFGGVGGSQTRSTNGTTLTSTTDGAVGYSNRNVFTPTLVNSAFPTLNRSVGFSVDFRLRVISESHVPNNRAGFSVILLDQGPTPQGIELGFWSDSIFSQKGGSTPFQAIGERINAFATTAATSYSLRILDQAYYLLANNRLVLSGSVQDYNLWPKDPLLPYNPYTTPNFLFLGDNTRSAAASVELGTISLGVAVTGTNAADTYAGTAAADTFNGLDGADQLSGGDSNDWLAGGAGSDILNGGAGDDLLIGGSQADRFLFSSGAIFNASQLGMDTIMDFNPAEDRLRLARTTFSALAPGPTLAAGAFAVVTSDAAAATSAALIAYNTSNGSLFYNPNGTAAGFAASPSGGGLFAQLLPAATGSPFPTLTSGAFEIV